MFMTGQYRALVTVTSFGKVWKWGYRACSVEWIAEATPRGAWWRRALLCTGKRNFAILQFCNWIINPADWSRPFHTLASFNDCGGWEHHCGGQTQHWGAEGCEGHPKNIQIDTTAPVMRHDVLVKIVGLFLPKLRHLWRQQISIRLGQVAWA